MAEKLEKILEKEKNEKEIIKAKETKCARTRFYGFYVSKVALTCSCGHQKVYWRTSFIDYLKKEGWGNPNNSGVNLDDFRKNYHCKNCDPTSKELDIARPPYPW